MKTDTGRADDVPILKYYNFVIVSLIRISVSSKLYNSYSTAINVNLCEDKGKIIYYGRAPKVRELCQYQLYLG